MSKYILKVIAACISLLNRDVLKRERRAEANEQIAENALVRSANLRVEAGLDAELSAELSKLV